MAKLASLSPEARKTLMARSLRRCEEDSLAAIAQSHQGTVFPLSPGQKRIWILHRFEPESCAYNSALAVRFTGALLPSLLERALNLLEDRHEILRTTFLLIDEEPEQHVHAPQHEPVTRVDISQMPRETMELWINRFLQSEASRPFSLDQLPLLRKTLIVLGKQKRVLSLTFHHILSDEWSIGILVKETAELYRLLMSSSPRSLPPPLIQYADYAVWQYQQQKNKVFDKQLQYWSKALAGVQLLRVPLDWERPEAPSYRGDVVTRPLSPETTAWVELCAMEAEATPFMVLLAIFQVFLGFWTGQDDIAVGTAIANRNEPLTENSIGFYVNTVVLRAQIDRRESFHTFLNCVRKNLIDAYSNQEVPFDMVVDALSPARRYDSSPLFQVFFQTIPMSDFDWPDIAAELISIPRVTSKFDLSLFIRETAEGLFADWNYATALFQRTTIELISEKFAVLLDLLARTPQEPLEEICQQAGCPDLW